MTGDTVVVSNRAFIENDVTPKISTEQHDYQNTLASESTPDDNHTYQLCHWFTTNTRVTCGPISVTHIYPIISSILENYWPQATYLAINSLLCL